VAHSIYGAKTFTLSIGIFQYINMRIFEKSKYPEVLNEQQKSVLCGLMLGDGHICRDVSRQANSYLSVKRNINDVGFNEWIAKVFGNMLPPTPLYTQRQLDKRNGMTYHMSGFRSKNCVVLNEYRDLWYNDSVKIIPNNLSLDSLAIAIWFCDDGWISQTTSKNRIKIGLSTAGFTKQEVEYLRQLLVNRYNESFTLSKSTKNKEQYVICAADAASRALIVDIDSVYPDGMDRKRMWDNPEVCFYSNIPERGKNWQTIHKERNRKIEIFLSKNTIFTIKDLCNDIGWIKSNGAIPTSEVKKYYIEPLIENKKIAEYSENKRNKQYIVMINERTNK
jgi:hypothetical protein